MCTVITFPRHSYRGFTILEQGYYPKVFHDSNPRQVLWEGLSVDGCKEWIDDLLRWLEN